MTKSVRFAFSPKWTINGHTITFKEVAMSSRDDIVAEIEKAADLGGLLAGLIETGVIELRYVFSPGIESTEGNGLRSGLYVRR